MKSNKVVFKTLVNVLIGIVLLGLYILAVVNAYGLFSGKFLLYAVLLVAGIAVSVFLYSLVHELGHLIVGLFAGLKFSKICVLFFLFEVENERVKFRFVKPTEFGYTEMLAKDEKDYGEKLAISSVGGLVFSVIIALVSMAICINNLNDIYLFCLFGATYPLALYIFLINALPFFDGSDGSLIFSVITDIQKPSVLKNYYTALASITLNKEPSELRGSLFEIFNDKPYSQNLKYIKYLSCLQSDFDKAYSEILDLSKLEICDDNLYFIVKKELFFCKVILGDLAYVEKHAPSIVGDIDISEDLCNFRVHAVYRIFIKDYKFAKLILQNGLEVLSKKTPNGFIKSEIKHLKELQSQLNSLKSL